MLDVQNVKTLKFTDMEKIVLKAKWFKSINVLYVVINGEKNKEMI